MAQVVSTKQKLNKIKNSHHFKLITFITKYGQEYTRLVQIGGGQCRILTNNETNTILETLKTLPEKEQNCLIPSFVDSDTQFYGETFWMYEELHTCYATSFDFNEGSLTVCEQPVDMLDIDEHFRFKSLKFTHDRYNYTIICRGTTPLTRGKTEQLFKETKIRLHARGKGQELDENTMTRTYANISKSTWLEIVRHVLTNNRDYYCYQQYITDLGKTMTIKINNADMMLI